MTTNLSATLWFVVGFFLVVVEFYAPQLILVFFGASRPLWIEPAPAECWPIVRPRVTGHNGPVAYEHLTLSRVVFT